LAVGLPEVARDFREFAQRSVLLLLGEPVDEYRLGATPENLDDALLPGCVIDKDELVFVSITIA